MSAGYCPSLSTFIFNKMKIKAALLVWLAWLLKDTLGYSQDRDGQDCYSTNNYPYLMFATRTAYDFIYERPRQTNSGIPDCEPVQLWMLARHGTRYPAASNIREMQQLENLRNTIIQNHNERRNGRLCYEDLDRLQSWTLNATFSEAMMLSRQGKADMYYLAKRYRSRFPQLFSQGYSQNLFQFRHTNNERTRQSANAFAEGLFGPQQSVWIPAPLVNDTILRPSYNCSAWIEQVHNNSASSREFELFKTGLEMNNVVHNVSQRLGFMYDLTVDTVLLIYDMCRYDKAWHLYEKSAWCAAFTRDELLVLEYAMDLQTFYKDGYGHPMNVQLGCRPIKDMMEKFSLLELENVENQYQPNGVFYFTHSSVLAMTLARLGIASQGKTLKHDNYVEQKDREWSSSKLTPFAANLAAVFYKCETGEQNRIMFYLNEKVVDYPGCDIGLCSWDDFKDRFRDLPDNCDLHWCSNGSPSSVPTTDLLLVLSIFLFFKTWS